MHQPGPPRANGRTPCIATRSAVEFTVVTRPTTSTSPAARTAWRAKVLSFPLDQLIHTSSTPPLPRHRLSSTPSSSASLSIACVRSVPDEGEAEPRDHLSQLLISLKSRRVRIDPFSTLEGSPESEDHRRSEFEEPAAAG